MDSRRLVLACVLLVATPAAAGEWPKEVRVYRGKTPRLDGRLAPGEWDDATVIEGVQGWTAQFTPTTDPRDLSLRVYVKHDGRDLYFAFDVTDDVLYGLDIERWLPDENPAAHELTRKGFPWFGDGVELLVNANNRWDLNGGRDNAGDGTSWQMVASAHKSRTGGIGKGGLLEGEPRSVEAAWNNYQRWITSGAMRAAVRLKPPSRGQPGHGFVIEWRVRPDPCLQVAAGKFWSPRLGEVRMGLNIGVQDLDEKERGEGNFGRFHHEDWWAGEKDKRTGPIQWGTMVVVPGPRRAAR
jgi:SSS family solute:Na+ symporter